MNSMITIIKKELKRFFTDKRLLAALILPGIGIYIMYSILGGVMTDLFEVDEDTTYHIHVLNKDDAMDKYFELDGLPTFVFTEILEEDLDTSKELVKNKDLDLIIIFDDNFNKLLNDGNFYGDSNVEIYYNNDSMESYASYMLMESIMSLIKDSILIPPFTVNGDPNIQYDLVDANATSSMILMMVPMLLLIFLVTGVMSVAVESIAGEKERGTIAALLITPISRFKLSFAKIISITIPSVMSAAISFAGLMLSLPKMFESSGLSMRIGSLSFFDILALFIVIIITVLLFTVLITIISTFAKSVKEATQLSSPLLILISMVGIIAAFIPNELWGYLIPVLNTSLTLTGVLGGTYELSHFLLTITSNLVLIAGGIYLVGKMFNSEKIIFNK